MGVLGVGRFNGARERGDPSSLLLPFFLKESIDQVAHKSGSLRRTQLKRRFIDLINGMTSLGRQVVSLQQFN